MMDDGHPMTTITHTGPLAECELISLYQMDQGLKNQRFSESRRVKKLRTVYNHNPCTDITQTPCLWTRA